MRVLNKATVELMRVPKRDLPAERLRTIAARNDLTVLTQLVPPQFVRRASLKRNGEFYIGINRTGQITLPLAGGGELCVGPEVTGKIAESGLICELQGVKIGGLGGGRSRGPVRILAIRQIAAGSKINVAIPVRRKHLTPLWSFELTTSSILSRDARAAIA